MATKASTSKASLSFYTEGTSYGTVNTSADYAAVRYETEDVQMREGTGESDEITDDRKPQSDYRNSLNVTGPVRTPFIYGVHDDWWEYAMLGDWGNLNSLVTNTVSCTFDNADNSINGTGVGANIIAGMFVRITGAADAGNNGLWKVATQAANKLTLLGGSITTNAVGASIEVEMGQGLGIGTGVTNKTGFTLVRRHSDITQFLINSGLLIDSATWDSNVDGKVSVTWNLRGKTQTAATAHPSSGTVQAANSRPAMNAVNHAKKYLIGSVLRDVSRFSWTIDNRNWQADAQGNLGPVQVAPGTAVASGTGVMYFENGQDTAVFFNGTERNLATCWTDTQGNSYVFSFPAARYTAMGLPIQGRDQGVFQNFSFSVRQSTTEVGGSSYGAVAVRIQRWAV